MWAGIGDGDRAGELLEPIAPARIGAADQKRRMKLAADVREPVETVHKGALVEEKLRPAAKRAVAPKRPQLHVKYFGGWMVRHGGACAASAGSRQAAL